MTILFSQWGCHRLFRSLFFTVFVSLWCTVFIPSDSSAATFASCRVCHGQSTEHFKGKGDLLKEWIRNSPNGVPQTHMWFSPELTKEVAESSLVLSGQQMKVEDSFYHRLAKLREAAKTREPDGEKRTEWITLIESAKKEVPGFSGVFWNPALEILKMKGSIRGHLLRVARAIMAPFRTVLLFPGQKAFYEQTLNTGVKGVGFIKGTSRQYDNELIYDVTGSQGVKTAVHLTLRDTKTASVVSADFLLDTMGTVSDFVSSPPDHCRARQFADNWIKAKRDRLDEFTTEYSLEPPEIAGRKIEPVMLVIDIVTRGIVLKADIEGEPVDLRTPCLYATGKFRQKQGEPMGIRGDMSLFMMANGLTAYSDVKMRFKKRIMGVMINGSTRNRMTINLHKSVVRPVEAQ